MCTAVCAAEWGAFAWLEWGARLCAVCVCAGALPCARREAGGGQPLRVRGRGRRRCACNPRAELQAAPWIGWGVGRKQGACDGLRPPPHPTRTPPPHTTGTGRRGGGGWSRQCQRWGTDEGGRGTRGERGSCGDCPGRGSMVKRGDKEGAYSWPAVAWESDLAELHKGRVPT